jgi:hypothetical protein
MEQALVFFNDIEVVIRGHLEETQNRVKQVAMLAGDAAYQPNAILPPAHLVVYRGELYRFGSRSKGQQQLYHWRFPF